MRKLREGTTQHQPISKRFYEGITWECLIYNHIW